MNNPAPHPQPVDPPPLGAAELAARLDSILIPLLATIAAHFRRLGPVTIPLWTRISRTRQLFARLLARLAAGRMPRRRPPRVTPRPKRTASTPAIPFGQPLGAAPVPPLSRRFAWVVIRIGYQAGGFASQLNHLLQQPGVAETLAASPGCTRSIRPLCRMLGIELPPALRPPPRPIRPPKPPAPKPTAAPVPAQPPGTPDRPLPAYIRAAVRAWKRGPQKFA